VGYILPALLGHAIVSHTSLAGIELASRLLRFGHRWAALICDPLRAIKGIRGLLWYVADYWNYRKMPGAERVRLLDTHPCLHERRAAHELDAHYFYVNAWAMRRILANHPSRHVDIASQTVLAGLLSAIIPVTYLDFRPLEATLPGLECGSGNISSLPYEDDCIESLSCPLCVNIAETPPLW
jgi:hypothetical protein